MMPELTREAEVFLLMVCRVAGVMMFAPVFGSDVVPVRVRLILSFVLALVFFPIVDRNCATIGSTVVSIVFAAGTEFGVGAVLGWAASLLFNAVQLGGQWIDQELGLNFAMVLDPMTQESTTIVAQLKLLLAVVIYLLLNGHHVLLSAIAESFRSIPLLGAHWGQDATMYLSDTLVADLFAFALRVAAPVVVASVLVTCALAFLSRTMPELNVFSVGFGLRVMLGLGVLALAIGSFATLFEQQNARQVDVLRHVLSFLSS